MVKFKYTWAFVVAVIGNAYIWIEAEYEFFQSIVRSLTDQTFLPASFYELMIGLIFCVCGILAYNQLRLSRFSRDQRWPLTALCVAIPGFIMYIVYIEYQGTVRDTDVFGYIFLWSLLCMLFYSIRYVHKPNYLKSQLGLIKFILMTAILLSGMLASMQVMYQVFSIVAVDLEFLLPLGYLALLQLLLPILMLLHVIDLHQRQKVIAGQREMEMIESLGTE